MEGRFVRNEEGKQWYVGAHFKDTPAYKVIIERSGEFSKKICYPI